MARKRKPGRPKGSKNKKKSKARRSTKRKSKATPAQLRALKKAWAARRKMGKKSRKKGKRKSKATAKQIANLAYARAVRADRRMPKTMRMAAADAIAATVRNPHPTSMPSILLLSRINSR